VGNGKTRSGAAVPSPTVARAGRVLRALLPEGRPLPPAAWRRRHRLLLTLLWLHVPAIVLFAVAMGTPLAHGAGEAAPVAALAGLAGWGPFGGRIRAALTTVGLFSCSAILVHLSGGYIEAHFHFFLVVGLVALYQDWVAFLLGVGYVVLHHGLAGALAPEAVYNHPAAQAHPWRWATIHGAFILVACGTALTGWRLKEEERARAETDPLTDLPNRGAVLAALDEALDRAAAGPTSLLLVDLDGLKAVNDAHGHSAGDAALRAAAAVLRDAAGRGGVAGRYGGDEFLVVLPGTGAEAAREIAGRLLAQAAAMGADGGAQVRLSIGAASAPRDGATAGELVRAADRAMYGAKRAGGGMRAA